MYTQCALCFGMHWGYDHMVHVCLCALWPCRKRRSGMLGSRAEAKALLRRRRGLLVSLGCILGLTDAEMLCAEHWGGTMLCWRDCTL